METLRLADYTRKKQKEVELRGGRTEIYTANGEEWVYIIYPMVPKDK